MENMCEACGYPEDMHGTDSHEFVPKVEETSALERELASVLNKHSAENGSNTPDFILAGYLMACLKAYNETTKKALDWRGVGYLNVGTKDV